MVNRKLSPKDEIDIYDLYLMGNTYEIISKKYKVVPSTIQRVVKKKNLLDNSKKSYVLGLLSKHIKVSTEHLEFALQSFNIGVEEKINDKQRDHLLDIVKQNTSKMEDILKKIEELQL